jgi:hypothetical protein
MPAYMSFTDAITLLRILRNKGGFDARYTARVIVLFLVSIVMLPFSAPEWLLFQHITPGCSMATGLPWHAKKSGSVNGEISFATEKSGDHGQPERSTGAVPQCEIHPHQTKPL